MPLFRGLGSNLPCLADALSGRKRVRMMDIMIFLYRYTYLHIQIYTHTNILFYILYIVYYILFIKYTCICFLQSYIQIQVCFAEFHDI